MKKKLITAKQFLKNTMTLTQEERSEIYESYSKEQKDYILSTAKKTGLIEVLIVDYMESFVIKFENKWKINLYDKRIRALKGHSFYLSKPMYDEFLEAYSLLQYFYFRDYLTGGLQIEKEGNAYCIFRIKKIP